MLPDQLSFPLAIPLVLALVVNKTNRIVEFFYDQEGAIQINQRLHECRMSHQSRSIRLLEIARLIERFLLRDAQKVKITEKFTKNRPLFGKKLFKRVQNMFFLNNIRLERVAFIICAIVWLLEPAQVEEKTKWLEWQKREKQRHRLNAA